MQTNGVAELFGTAQAFAASGQLALAESLYRDWLARHPDAPLRHAVCFNHGVVLTALQDWAGAAQSFAEAIRVQPGFLPPYINLGTVLERFGEAAAALTHWDHVIAALGAVQGESVAHKATALKLRAQLLESRKQLAPAEDALRQIIELGHAPRDVVQHWISLRQRQASWPLLEPVGPLQRHDLLRVAAPLSLANYADDPILQLAGAAAYCRDEFGMPGEFRTSGDFAELARPRQRRLRIGYLSSDLRGHAIGYLTAEMFGLHDRGAFEIYVYYCGIPQDDTTKQRIRSQVEHWVDIAPLDDDAALRRLLEDRIDILVDVNGHTRGARTRLLSRRPAPVIVNWLGFPGTMGSAFHHYIIADGFIIPPGDEHHYSEAVLRLPCYQPNDRQRVVAEPPPRAALGLPDDAVVFCSFNGTQKITPFVFARWMAILRDMPGSVLWLLQGSDDVDVRLRERAAAAGVAPERLVFAPMLGNAEHVARYARADLFLDTSPYGAHTTASDALWMGLPVLTTPGRCFASRVCASLVRAAGLSDLVMPSHAAYVERAVALGRDRPLLAAYRERLRQGRDGALLFDTPLLVRTLEALFREMWAAFVAGRLPTPSLVNLDAYLEIGAGLDHDGREFGGDVDAPYRQGLALRHAFSPLPFDRRLWPAPAMLPRAAAA